MTEGASEITIDGGEEGKRLGIDVGPWDGTSDGKEEGDADGKPLGFEDGSLEGVSE